MEKEQAKIWYEKAPVKARFSSYYKYSFTFSGENEYIKDLVVSFGGNADDIYHESVDCEEFELPKTFEELMENYSFVSFRNRENGEKFERYNY